MYRDRQAVEMYVSIFLFQRISYGMHAQTQAPSWACQNNYNNNFISRKSSPWAFHLPVPIVVRSTFPWVEAESESYFGLVRPNLAEPKHSHKTSVPLFHQEGTPQITTGNTLKPQTFYCDRRSLAPEHRASIQFSGEGEKWKSAVAECVPALECESRGGWCLVTSSPQTTLASLPRYITPNMSRTVDS